MENPTGKRQEDLNLTQVEYSIDKVQTPAERSAEKWSLQPWKDKYEELLANFTGSGDNVRAHLERDLNLADADRSETSKNKLRELKGVILEKSNDNTSDNSKSKKTRREFATGVGGLRKSINEFLVNSLEYIKSNEMSSLKPGILETASGVEELFVEKANAVKKREHFETSINFEGIKAFFNGDLKFETLSKSDLKVVKNIVEKVYGRGSVVFDIAKRNVPIPNHQKVKFIEELNNLKL